MPIPPLYCKPVWCVFCVPDVILRLEGLAAGGGGIMATTGIPLSDLTAIGAVDAFSLEQEQTLSGVVGGLLSVAAASNIVTSSNVSGGSSNLTSCPVCGKKVQVSYLSLHLKRTHDSLEARCPLCDKKFKNKHSLSVHQARYHPRHHASQPQQSTHLALFQNSVTHTNHNLPHHPLQNCFMNSNNNCLPGGIFPNMASMAGMTATNTSLSLASPNGDSSTAWLSANSIAQSNDVQLISDTLEFPKDNMGVFGRDCEVSSATS